MSEALRANDLLCGNDPKEGWNVSYTGHKKSLQRHLSQHLIKHPSQIGSVGLVGATGGVCEIAAKLGAVIIAEESEQSRVLASTPTIEPTVSQKGKKAPAFKGKGFVFSPVNTGPTLGVPKKAKVVLKPNTINRVKQAMPTQS